LVETLPVALKDFNVPGVIGPELMGTLLAAVIELLIFLAELFV
jgi:hypothetical protein